MPGEDGDVKIPQIDNNIIAQINIGGFISMVRFFSGEPGTPTIQEFLNSITSAGELGAWTDKQKVAVLKSRVIGPALLFFRACNFKEADTLETITNRLRDWYKEAPGLLDPLHSYYSCAQRPMEGAKAFLTRLKLAGISAISSGRTEEDREHRKEIISGSTLSVFINGIREDSGANYLLMNPPADIDTAVELATIFENRHGSKKKAYSVTIRNPPVVPPVQPAPTPITQRQNKAPRNYTIPEATKESQIDMLLRSVDRLVNIMSRPQQPIAPIPRMARPNYVSNNANQSRPIQRSLAEPTNSILCYRCGQLGHYAPSCTAPINPDRTRLQCDKCQRSGHSTRECRNRPVPRRSVPSQDTPNRSNQFNSRTNNNTQNFARR